MRNLIVALIVVLMVATSVYGQMGISGVPSPQDNIRRGVGTHAQRNIDAMRAAQEKNMRMQEAARVRNEKVNKALQDLNADNALTLQRLSDAKDAFNKSNKQNWQRYLDAVKRADTDLAAERNR